MTVAGPTVGEYMTKVTHFVAPQDSLVKAQELMQAHGIRHLPVVTHGRVVGMVTLSDLFIMEAVMEVDPDETEVGSAMAQEIYCVQPDTPLAVVAREMAHRRIGSAVVLEGRALAGIFTASDACRVLGDLLAGGAQLPTS